ncbi:Transposase IS116/IS110/IS902 family protein [Pseudovibrio sp. Ad37]|nr:Transposase IS116/IS110/IS902 family protein [Pseudovibrio sp. Ad37]
MSQNLALSLGTLKSRSCAFNQKVSLKLGHQIVHPMVSFSAELVRFPLSGKAVGCQLLMSIPGIGSIISTALVAAIGNGSAFERGRDLGAWLGLVPRQYSTVQETNPS